MSLLEVSHLTKAYNGKPAVDDLSFRVEAGEIFGLLGPNGAGKTTAMMVIAGLRPPDGGTVRMGDISAANGTPVRNRILGLVPQELAIYPDLTGRENLEFFGRIYSLRGPTLRKRVEMVLDEIGLVEHAERYVRTYSGGMKRRLNFGAGLLHEPKLVILDEPTVGVDPQSRAHLLDSVRRLASSGVGVLFATHYMEEAEAICDRVGIMDRGKLLKCGTSEELLDSAEWNVRIDVTAPAEKVSGCLQGLADVEALDEREAEVVFHPGQNGNGKVLRHLGEVMDRLATAGAELESIETREQNLEQLFLDLTGRKLRE